MNGINLKTAVGTPFIPFDVAQDRLRYAQETARLSTNGVATVDATKKPAQSGHEEMRQGERYFMKWSA